MNKRIKGFAVSLAVAGLAAGVAMGQSSGTGTGVAAGAASDYANQDYGNQVDPGQANNGHGSAWHRHEHGQQFLRMFRQLGLSADQKTQIKGILADARAARQKNAAERQAARAQMAALANPGDPNYATALQAAKTRAANAIQNRSDLQMSLYNVLTPQQKTQLTQLIAARRAERAAGLQGRQSLPAATT